MLYTTFALKYVFKLLISIILQQGKDIKGREHTFYKLTNLNNIVIFKYNWQMWTMTWCNNQEKLGCNYLLIFIRKYGDIIIYFGLVMLRNALGDPDNVPALLFFQLQEGIEYTKMELLHKCVSVQVDFVLEKLVFQCFFARVGARAFKALFVVLQRRSNIWYLKGNKSKH